MDLAVPTFHPRVLETLLVAAAGLEQKPSGGNKYFLFVRAIVAERNTDNAALGAIGVPVVAFFREWTASAANLCGPMRAQPVGCGLSSLG